MRQGRQGEGLHQYKACLGQDEFKGTSLGTSIRKAIVVVMCVWLGRVECRAGEEQVFNMEVVSWA